MAANPYFGSGYFGSGYFGASEPASLGSLRSTVSAVAIVVGTASGAASLFGEIGASASVSATATSGADLGHISAAIFASASVFASASASGMRASGGGSFWVNYRAPRLIVRSLWAPRIKAGSEVSAGIVGAVFAHAEIKGHSAVSARANATAAASMSAKSSAVVSPSLMGAALAAATTGGSTKVIAGGSALLVISKNSQFDATEDEMAIVFALAA